MLFESIEIRQVKNGVIVTLRTDEDEDQEYKLELDTDEMVGGAENAIEQAIDQMEADERPVEVAGIKDVDAAARDADELEGDEVLAAIGDASYQGDIQRALQSLKQHQNEYLSPEGLKTYSPKFLAMLDNIEDEEHKGCHLVYSQFRSMEGIGIFAMTLEANGFSRFKIKRTSIDSWEIDMSEEEIGKPCYALYTGTEDAEEREIIRNIYNGAWEYIPNNIAAQLKQKSTNNNMGEIIKVLMITAAGSEGINLRNTRYVHIMEPYWHPVRTEQVIGRARRICSHKDLPRDKQTVEVFVYIMVFTKEQLKDDYSITLRTTDVSKRDGKPITSDQKLLEISDIKAEINAQLLKTIKETSIDCATHAKSNQKEQLMCLSFGNPNPDMFTYNPSYNQDQNDTVASLNEEKKTWHLKEITIKGVKYALDNNTMLFYDYQSAMKAQHSNNQMRPKAIGTLVVKENGKYQVEYK